MITSFVASEVNESLAEIGVDLLWSSALVLTLAMLSFTLDLAGHPGRVARAQARRTARTHEQIEEAGDTAVLTEVDTPGAPEKRQWGGIGISLAWLGTLLLIGSVAARAFSVHRPPLGNMYEFAIVGSAFVMLCYLLWALRHDVRWLGAFVTGTVVLFEMLAAMVFFTEASQLMPSLRATGSRSTSPWRPCPSRCSPSRSCCTRCGSCSPGVNVSRANWPSWTPSPARTRSTAWRTAS